MDKKNKKSRTTAFFNVIFSGAALMSDGYQSGAISFVNLALSKIYGDVVFNDTVSSRLSYAMFVGCVVGQVFFGFFVDRIGRKAGLVTTTVLVILGAAMSAASSGVTSEGLLWMMVISRGVLGVGVGGEYPCSSVAAGESADSVSPGNRGKLFVMVTNFMIDFGYVLSAVVPVILLAIFSEDRLEPVWRLVLGLGILPPLSVLYFRVKMGETAHYKKNALKKQVPYLLIFKRYWKRIFAASFTWFVYNFISFPNGVFSSVIISQVASGQPMIITAAWNILLYAFYLPGCISGAFLTDKIGRRKTLVLGLVSLGVVGMIIGGALDPLSQNCFPMFVILYGIFLGLAEMGPGANMGLIAMEMGPSSVRGTCYGIAAAFGKVGATIGTVAFGPMKDNLGLRAPFLVSSGIAIATGIFAWFAIEDISNEALGAEDVAFKQYLKDNGYDTSSMGLDGHTDTDKAEVTSIHQVSKTDDKL
ncbi:major facilitator superfamily domain-containing protein [Absidia repens]|uniref:Major facilitator superfamily domain-containing protein n=1 Tax=Absidia repens TaxID=90262 RepID=A0A1X2IQX8_9FUNG|nr:major facilitator superfamily domain-containing protein [Absidia repens]